jgi:serine protease Do
MSVRVQVEEQTEDKMALFSDRTVNKTWGVSLDTLSPQLARELDVPDTTKGAVILELDPQGQAAKLRLQPGDVILKINDSQVDSATMASELLSKVSRNLSMVIQRGPVQMQLSATIQR